MSVRVLVGSALDVLRTLPSESVQLVCTSPPYFGLRSYSTAPQVWGGDPECRHAWVERNEYHNPGDATAGPKQKSNIGAVTGRGVISDAFCPCGSWRGELGSEPTPALFIEHLLTIFDEVWRVLRKDGLCFVNLGDSMSGSGKGPTGKNGLQNAEQRQGFESGYWSTCTACQDEDGPKSRAPEAATCTWCNGAGRMLRKGGRKSKTEGVGGIPAKNLLLIPERFSIAMQGAGWICRSRIAWCKTSAMPESTRDRPTSAWEHIWMFSKSQRYYFDQDAVRTPAKSEWQVRTPSGWDTALGTHGAFHRNGRETSQATGDVRNGGANLRNFWLLGPSPFADAHFATFPPEIPRRCILAGTSERGACPSCGAGWRRVVEKGQARASDGRDQYGAYAYVPQDRMVRGDHCRSGSGGTGALPRRERIDRGWQPGCSCDVLHSWVYLDDEQHGDDLPAGICGRCGASEFAVADDALCVVPCVVLDPFLGSGTTALVADRLGRDAIGIELSPSYARMAEERLKRDAGPMFSEGILVDDPGGASSDTARSLSFPLWNDTNDTGLSDSPGHDSASSGKA